MNKSEVNALRKIATVYGISMKTQHKPLPGNNNRYAVIIKGSTHWTFRGASDALYSRKYGKEKR
jgi:hypothetical protein